MTQPKRPLPSLRFAMLPPGGPIPLIPQTDRKGRVISNRWCMPGGKVWSTEQVIAHCKKNKWAWRIDGESNQKRRSDL